jgi:hypothetical protein
MAEGLIFGTKFLFYFVMVSVCICLSIISYFTVHFEFRNMVSGKKFLKRSNIICYSVDELQEVDKGTVDGGEDGNDLGEFEDFEDFEGE